MAGAIWVESLRFHLANLVCEKREKLGSRYRWSVEQNTIIHVHTFFLKLLLV